MCYRCSIDDAIVKLEQAKEYIIDEDTGEVLDEEKLTRINNALTALVE